MKFVALIALLQILLCLIQPALIVGRPRKGEKTLALYSEFVGTYVNVPGTTGAALTLMREDEKVGVVYLVATRFDKGNAQTPNTLPVGAFANANHFTFTFDDSVDTIVVSGIWKGDNPNTLAIVGGTGKYKRASGYATTTDNAPDFTVTTYNFFFN